MKLSIVSLGCNKNQVDGEFLIAKLSHFFEISGDPKACDIIILSPCSFLESARDEALEYIERFREYKKKFSVKCLVVIGCYAEFLGREALKHEGVDIVVGLSSAHEIVDAINRFFQNGASQKIFSCGDKKIYGLFDDNVERIVSAPNSAYIKISDGCDNYCSYCLIPRIRGSYRSRDAGIIIDEINSLIDSGIKEINLIAQDLGAYGSDLNTGYNFSNLLEDITKYSNPDWIRLLYMHPLHITESLIDIIKRNDNICKYIDIPIQHINDRILKLMNRKIRKKEIIQKILMLKEAHISLRTTLMVGFPSETEKDFNELADFVDMGYFDKVGVFTYSPEKGTKSFGIDNQVPDRIKERRYNHLLSVQQKISKGFNERYLDKILKVLPSEIVSQEEKILRGRTEFMAPEVDGDIYVKMNSLSHTPDFLNVKVTKVDSYDLEGEIK